MKYEKTRVARKRNIEYWQEEFCYWLDQLCIEQELGSKGRRISIKVRSNNMPQLDAIRQMLDLHINVDSKPFIELLSCLEQTQFWLGMYHGITVQGKEL